MLSQQKLQLHFGVWGTQFTITTIMSKGWRVVTVDIEHKNNFQLLTWAYQQTQLRLQFTLTLTASASLNVTSEFAWYRTIGHFLSDNNTDVRPSTVLCNAFLFHSLPWIKKIRAHRSLIPVWESPYFSLHHNYRLRSILDETVVA